MNCYFFLIKKALILSPPPAPQPLPARVLHSCLPVTVQAASGNKSQGLGGQLLCLPACEPGVSLFRERDSLLQVSVKNIKYLA